MCTTKHVQACQSVGVSSYCYTLLMRVKASSSSPTLHLTFLRAAAGERKTAIIKAVAFSPANKVSPIA